MTRSAASLGDAARPRASRRGPIQEMMMAMSTENASGDSQQTGGAGESEHDADELLRRLRSAPAEEIVTDLFSTLLSTAQVKLGRRDARLFIDLCTLMSEYAGRFVSADLTKQVQTALGQLRLNQVSAEHDVAEKGEAEPNDLSRIPTPPTTGGRPEASCDNPSASDSEMPR